MTTQASAAEAYAEKSQYHGLLREAAQWRLLARLFTCPDATWREHVRALAEEVADDALRQAARTADEEADEGVYHTTFGPGGPAAPREVSYQQSALSGQFLADLETFYRAFGYSPPRDEPPDHIAVEVDFMAYLKLKQAFAAASLQDEQFAVTADAIQAFLTNHLSLISSRLAEALAASGIRYLELAASALLIRTRVSENRTMVMPFDPAPSASVELPICPPEGCCDELVDD